jgi:outer membrane protein assembly factor BamB
MSRRPRPLVLLVVLIPLLAPPAPARAAESMTQAVLRARAERAAVPPGSGRAALLGVGAGHLLFSMTAVDSCRIVRALPDVNGDGREEVLAGIDHSGVDDVFALDGASQGTANVVWGFQPTDGASGGSPYGDQCLEAASDSNGNKAPEILAGTAWGGRTAYRLDGAAGGELWKFDTYQTAASGWVYSLAELNDIVGDDGKPEVAFGTGSDSNSVYLVDGASSGQATVVWHYAAADAVTSVRDLGDVNDDGDDDVVAAVSDFGEEIVCLDGGTVSPTGHVLWSYPTGTTAYAVGVLPDITGDGKNEALAVLWTGGGSAIRALNGATGALVWASTQVGQNGVMVDLLQDVTGDGVPEVIVSSFENAVIVLNGATGAQVWKTPVGTTNSGDVWTARAIGDLDGDGYQDVIAGSFDYHVYAMNGRTGAIFWAYDTGNRVFSVYPVGDLDGDGRPEVAVGTQATNSNEVVYVLDGDAGVPIFADGFESGDTGAWSATVP